MKPWPRSLTTISHTSRLLLPRHHRLKPRPRDLQRAPMRALERPYFERLVHDEEDVVGLLAYSLSMQNKRDWLLGFHTEVGRDPTSAEVTAYEIGERIERRLATYRKLAEHALSGNAFWASATLTPVSELPGAPALEPSTPQSAKHAGKQGWFSGKSR